MNKTILFLGLLFLTAGCTENATEIEEEISVIEENELSNDEIADPFLEDELSLLEIRKPYEEQRYLEGAGDRHPDEFISQVQFWLQTTLNSPLTLNEIAQQFGISQRSFTRRFKLATGVNANQYWQKLKIETGADYIQVGIVGKDVPHVHVHLVPRMLADTSVPL